MNKGYFRLNEEYNIEDLIYSLDAWVTTSDIFGILLMLLIISGTIFAYTRKNLLSINLFLMGILVLSFWIYDYNFKKGKVEISQEKMESIVEFMKENEYSLFEVVDKDEDNKDFNVLTIHAKDLDY